MCKTCQKRQQFLVRILQNNPGDLATISGTGGGLNFMPGLPVEINDVKLSDRLSTKGIVAHPLHDYHLHQSARLGSRLNGLVLGFACASEAQLEKAATILVEHINMFK